MKEWKFREIIQVLEDAGFEPKPYTGRHMSGTECVSVSCDRSTDVTATVVKKFVDDALELNPIHLNRQAPGILERVSSLIDVLQRASVDQLGRSLVAYWPQLEWEEETDDEYEKTEQVHLSPMEAEDLMGTPSLKDTLPSRVDLKESTTPKKSYSLGVSKGRTKK